MTAQFSTARRQGLQDFDQPIHANGVREGDTLCCLAIEVTAIANFRAAMSQRYGEIAGHFSEHGAQRLPKVDVLMGVDVGRVLTNQTAERRQLTRHFIRYRSRVVDGDYLV